MTDDGYFFLLRLRKNPVIREVFNFKLPKNTSVLSDQMVLIGTTQNRAENYFRLLKVLDSKGNELNLITNRFDLSADEISTNHAGPLNCFSKGLKNISASKSSTVKVNVRFKINYLSRLLFFAYMFLYKLKQKASEKLYKLAVI